MLNSNADFHFLRGFNEIQSRLLCTIGISLLKRVLESWNWINRVDWLVKNFLAKKISSGNKINFLEFCCKFLEPKNIFFNFRRALQLVLFFNLQEITSLKHLVNGRQQQRTVECCAMLHSNFFTAFRVSRLGVFSRSRVVESETLHLSFSRKNWNQKKV